MNWWPYMLFWREMTSRHLTYANLSATLQEVMRRHHCQWTVNIYHNSHHGCYLAVKIVSNILKKAQGRKFEKEWIQFIDYNFFIDQKWHNCANKFPNLGVYHANFPNLKGPRVPSKNWKKIPGWTNKYSLFHKWLCIHGRLRSALASWHLPRVIWVFAVRSKRGSHWAQSEDRSD